MRRAARRSLLALLLSPLAACTGSPTAPSAHRITVLGSIENGDAVPIPENARLVVLWTVAFGSPDYRYVFGQGTIADDGASFTLRLDRRPPPAALNAGGFGVGTIVLTTDTLLADGAEIAVDSLPAVFAAAPREAVIYATAGGGDLFGDWLLDFAPGYTVGRGVERPGQPDAFEPVDSAAVAVVVGEAASFDFVGWIRQATADAAAATLAPDPQAGASASVAARASSRSRQPVSASVRSSSARTLRSTSATPTAPPSARP